MRTTYSFVLVFAALTGCAADGDPTSGGGAGGGKADGAYDGLSIRAQVTKLGPQNEIRWPVAVDEGSEVDNAINSKLGFEDITGENLDETKARWAGAPDEPQLGVVAADFEVTANLRNVLSLSIGYETMGAYPDFQNAYFNFDNRIGTPIGITDLLDAEALPAIAAKLDVLLQERIATRKMEVAADIASGDVDPTTWDGLHVTASDLESFTTTPEGITFHYDTRFPHAIVALAPDSDFAVPFEDLDSAINATGAWADEY